MTTREFLVSVLTVKGLSEELAVKAQELLDGLDHKNELRKAKQETSNRREAVLAFLTTNEGVFVREDIAKVCGITEGQVTSACSALVREGLVIKTEVKVDKAKKTAYSAAKA